MWSDKTGHHSSTKESVRLPGGGWSWAGDWVTDHHTPGGTDKEGWQYATDFPATYHPEPSFTDYVRYVSCVSCVSCVMCHVSCVMCHACHA